MGGNLHTVNHCSSLLIGLIWRQLDNICISISGDKGNKKNHGNANHGRNVKLAAPALCRSISRCTCPGPLENEEGALVQHYTEPTRPFFKISLMECGESRKGVNKRGVWCVSLFV